METGSAPTRRWGSADNTRLRCCWSRAACGRGGHRRCRRDVLLTHLWETPKLYRGVPIHILGGALKVLRYPSKLSPKDWLYEAWVITPENRRAPFCCIFEDAPEGFPIGANVSERVVFNGYFLKFMTYEANGTAHRAPVLVGRIGWQPSEPAPKPGGRPNPPLDAHHPGDPFLRIADALDLQLRRFLNPPPARRLRS